MVSQSRQTGGRVCAARPRLDEHWLYRREQNHAVGCLSGKHIALDKFQGKHSKSKTAKSNVGGTTWPFLAGIGRVGALPFRHSPVTVGCQCFLLRQERFVRNMCCHVFSIVQPPQRAKSALIICGILFIGFNIYASTHYDLRRFALCLRAFYSINGLLIGMAITLALLLWPASEETRASQNGVAPGTVAGSGTAPDLATF